MTVNIFAIAFNSLEDVYFAGQEITGKVLIQASECLKINDILFEIKGRAKTNWTTKSKKNFLSNEPYFCEQFSLSYVKGLKRADDFDNTNARVLPKFPEKIEIPFSYTLPKALPSSFEGEHGFVRYTCRAILERPWDFDIICSQAFTVIGIEDVNDEAKGVLTASLTFPVTFKCIRMGNLQVDFQLEKGSYTPGFLNFQPNDERFEVFSRRSIKHTQLTLTTTVVYRGKNFAGHESSKRTTKVISRVFGPGICRQSEINWKDASIILPSVPPRLSRCSIIDVSYNIEFLISLYKKAVTSIQIVVGTLPLLTEEVIRTKKLLTGVLSPASSAADRQKEMRTVTNNCFPSVLITDELGRTITKSDTEEKSDSEIDQEFEKIAKSRKRVRVPSSILTELYPALPYPFYNEVYSGAINLSDEKCNSNFIQKTFAPKYPFYF